MHAHLKLNCSDLAHVFEFDLTQIVARTKAHTDTQAHIK